MKKTKIVFASGSAGKIAEMDYLINKYLTANGRGIELLSLKDAGFTDEIIEDGATFEENAEIKAKAVFDKTGMICFADDSGLCVDYLNGGPGLQSAFYGSVAGERPPVNASIDKLLKELYSIRAEERTAHFYCAICCIVSPSEKFFASGRCNGIIISQKIGKNGFGYDPIFYYPPAKKTFGQMDDEEKNKFSHRALAAEQFAEKIVKYI